MWGEKCSRDLDKDKARAVTMALVAMALVTTAPGMKALVAMALVVMTLVLTHPPSHGKGESKAWRSSRLGLASALLGAGLLHTTNWSAAFRKC